MEEKNFNDILKVFENGTELNLGIYPDTNIVKYGYNYTENGLTLYIQGSGKDFEKIKNYVEQNQIVHFNKWSKEGIFVRGEGTVLILKTEEEKLTGLKKIMKQQNKTESNGNFDKNEIMNLFLCEIKVNNTETVKY